MTWWGGAKKSGRGWFGWNRTELSLISAVRNFHAFITFRPLCCLNSSHQAHQMIMIVAACVSGSGKNITYGLFCLRCRCARYIYNCCFHVLIFLFGLQMVCLLLITCGNETHPLNGGVEPILPLAQRVEDI